MTLDEILQEQKQAYEAELALEIKKLESGKAKRIRVIDGVRVSTASGRTVYRFEMLEDKRLREDSFIKLYTPDHPKGISGNIGSVENQFVTLVITDDIGQKVEIAEVEEDITELLKKIIAKLWDISYRPKAYHRDIAFQIFYPQKSISPIQHLEQMDLNDSQYQALTSAFAYNTSFIWGPPGTGKTRTLGRIVLELVRQGKKVLLSAHANKAADNALYQAVKAFKDAGIVYEDKITRYGPLLFTGDSEIDLKPLSFEENLKKTEKEPHILQISGKVTDSPEINQIQAKIAELDGEIRNLENQSVWQQKFYSLIGRTIDSLKLKRQELEMALEKEMTESVTSKYAEKGETSQSDGDSNGMDMFFRRQLLSSYQVVVSSLAKVAVDKAFDDMEFDCLVVDEASMVPMPLLAIASAYTKERVVIIGDPQQLPPITQVEGNEFVDKWLKRDIFMASSGKQDITGLYSWLEEVPFTSFLSFQYRMPENLSGLVSRHFYQKKLVCADSSKGDGIIEVIDTSSRNPKIEGGEYGNSRQNPVHMETAIELVNSLVIDGASPETIGIITPYKPQSMLIRKTMRDRGIKGIEVGTVHSFQGREKETIIFDTTDVPGSKGSFWDEKGWNRQGAIQLLTVAFSRSRRNLYIIAHRQYLRLTFPGRKLTEIVDEIA
jgi:superfamily I DNA and/or RNA helicase